MTQEIGIKLETQRLQIIPLAYDQLLEYRKFEDPPELQLGLTPFKKALPVEPVQALETFIIPYVSLHPEHILYATLWIIIHKEKNVIVGDIGFKGAPTEGGVIEVSYSLYPEFGKNGFMTEALKSITEWAFEQPEVQIILAETDKKNLPSQRILDKNHFIPFAETDLMYWWRLDREVQSNP